MASAALVAAVATQYGFLTEAQVREMATTEDRLTLVLVRCGGKRFMAPAQDVEAMIAAVEATGDYVRDCSLPADVSLRVTR
jgi:hypothetical protein